MRKNGNIFKWYEYLCELPQYQGIIITSDRRWTRTGSVYCCALLIRQGGASHICRLQVEMQSLECACGWGGARARAPDTSDLCREKINACMNMKRSVLEKVLLWFIRLLSEIQYLPRKRRGRRETKTEAEIKVCQRRYHAPLLSNALSRAS